MSGALSILGRALVLYEAEDDHEIEGQESQTSLYAGNRIACCVIGLAKGVVSGRIQPDPTPDPDPVRSAREDPFPEPDPERFDLSHARREFPQGMDDYAWFF